MAKKIGIDLGTTYSCMSYVDDMGIVRIIDNLEGEQTTPSVVFFSPNGEEVVVGSTARSEGAMNPECLVERVKNYMGNPDYKFFANGTEYSAAAVSSLILKKLISDAEAALGEEIDGAVITCPAYFGENERSDTKKAGENVVLSNGQNLKVLKILDEPTAAAIAYGNSRQEDMDKTILIYDLGGGTFDCTVMKLKFTGAEREMQVITTGGNHQLGGKDWDEALATHVREKFCEATGNDADEMKDDAESNAWFSENIEKAKKTLTTRETTSLSPSYNGTKERIEITREEFEEVTSELLDQTIMLVNDMMDKKGMSVLNDIDEIILVGGSTYMPQVSKRLENEYNKPISSYEPNKAVAMGAALVASEWSGEEEVPVIEGLGEVEMPVLPDDSVFSGGGFTLGGAVGKPATTIIENCTKSYGLRIFQNDQEKVLNLILKDTPKPAKGSSIDHFPLTITGTPDMVDQVNILILESDSLEALVDRSECKEIFVEEPIKFAGEVPGNNEVSVDITVDTNGIVTLYLTDKVTGQTYVMNPTRISDTSEDDGGLSAVKGMTLI